MFIPCSIHFIIIWGIHIQNIINVCKSSPFVISFILFPCTIVYIWPCCNLRELFHIFPPLHIIGFFWNVVETCRSTLVFGPQPSIDRGLSHLLGYKTSWSPTNKQHQQPNWDSVAWSIKHSNKNSNLVTTFVLFIESY